MRPAIAALVIGALSVSAAPQTDQSVIVEGCLQGKRFTPDLSVANTALIFGTLRVRELRLEGQPGLMRTLEKEHNGHQDEITGIVTVPDNRDAGVQSRPVGKRTRVTTTTSGSSPDPRPIAPGARTPSSGVTRGASTNTLPSPEWLRMKVTSLRHLNDKCQFAEPVAVGR